jgi:gamma-glutamyltranspeptidase / glutathione hydrolase
MELIMKKTHKNIILSIYLGLIFLFTYPILTGQVKNGDEKDAPKSNGKLGMVATANPLATQAAYNILKQGGNAVDAAVAAAFAIGVVEPDGSGLGGGGAMVIYLAQEKKSFFINYYQRASENIDELDYSPDNDRKSAKAILVPGTVDGLIKALENFGTLPLTTVLSPAIELAENGFPIDATLSSIILDNVELLQKYESTSAIYLRDGFPLMEGDTIVQPELAKTLRKISTEGRAGFYEGEIAERIAKEISDAGGILTTTDLKNYHAEILNPVQGNYRGYKIISAGPPQSGISVIEALNILENYNLKKSGHFSTSIETAHLLAETLRRVYADRSTYIGDPKFNNVPTNGLISKEYAKIRFSDVDLTSANPTDYRKTKEGNPFPYAMSNRERNIYEEPVNKKIYFSEDEDDEGIITKNDLNDIFDRWGTLKKNVKESTVKKDTLIKENVNEEEIEVDHEFNGETTHLSVADKDGNMVALTQTLGTFFGSGFTSAGVLFNCSMSNYSQNLKINIAEPNKQPRSAIAPTVILKNDKPFLVIGSPGATRIIATLVELIINIVDFDMDVNEANLEPRLFCQKFDDFLHLENRFSEEVKEGLEKKGHHLRIYGDYDLFFGGAQIISIDPITGEFRGSADIRRGGSAMGD